MTVLELLRLLAQDAPVDRIEEAAAKLVASDPVDGPAARALALAIRAGIDARRRREAELSALVDTARDLASRSDPGGVLDAIVRRARTLLATDVAYLTLADPERGDTYMRATAGSVSARFQTLRLPTGAGLGGLVAQTRRPYWTADYPADERYRHTTEIDAAVGEEGLVAICGTPLLVDGQFVGVLFAANRTRRPFRRDEVALLGSLAALAAVSLVQTRRSAETAAALDALSTAHAGIEQAATAHDRFTEVVLGGGGVDAIAAALAELLDCWVAVLDADGAPPGGPTAPCRTWSTGAPPAGSCTPTGSGRWRSRPSASASARWYWAGARSWTRARAARWSGPRWSRRWCCCSGCAPPRPTTGCAPTCSPTSCAATPPTVRWSNADGCLACGCASRTSWSCAAASDPAGCCWPRPRRAAAQASPGSTPTRWWRSCRAATRRPSPGRWPGGSR